MLDQYNVLKKEIAKFSKELASRKYAIVLRKSDAVMPEELSEKTQQFINEITSGVSKDNSFGFEKDTNYFLQDLTYNKYDENLPYFILPISSAVAGNIEPLKYVLYDLIAMSKNKEEE